MRLDQPVESYGLASSDFARAIYLRVRTRREPTACDFEHARGVAGCADGLDQARGGVGADLARSFAWRTATTRAVPGPRV